MSTLDYLLLALIVIAAFLALRFVRKGKKRQPKALALRIGLQR